MWRQTWASLFYVENWALAVSEVDYYARPTELASPLQHFWSLSVQGRVFVLWPLLAAAAVLLARRLGRSPRVVMLWAFGAVGLASLVYSVITTAADQTFAYFDTFARLWEFAIGSVIALALPWLRPARWLALLLGWGGLAALVLRGMVLDVQGGFPGYLALWPTLAAAAAVIVAGGSAVVRGPAGILASWPLQRLAVVSYALYLVHWPILIAYLFVTDSARADMLGGVVVVAVSVLAAILITYGVERPVERLIGRGAAVGRSLIAVGASVALVVVPLAGWQVSEALRSSQSDAPGAAVLFDPDAPIPDPARGFDPAGTDLEQEWAPLDGACTLGRMPTDSRLSGSCLELRAADATRKVLVIGDSHAQHWAGALVPTAHDRDWEVVALLKAGCSYAADEDPTPGVEGCIEWREAVPSYVERYAPDLVVMMGTKTTPDAPRERELRGLDETLDQIAAPVLLVRDNPRFDEDIFVCAEQHPPIGAACVRERDDVLAVRSPLAEWEGTEVGVADLSGYLCPAGVCPAVIGGVAVYLDDNHITQTYARSLAPVVAESVDRFTGWTR